MSDRSLLLGIWVSLAAVIAAGAALAVTNAAMADGPVGRRRAERWVRIAVWIVLAALVAAIGAAAFVKPHPTALPGDVRGGAVQFSDLEPLLSRLLGGHRGATGEAELAQRLAEFDRRIEAALATGVTVGSNSWAWFLVGAALIALVLVLGRQRDPQIVRAKRAAAWIAVATALIGCLRAGVGWLSDVQGLVASTDTRERVIRSERNHISVVALPAFDDHRVTIELDTTDVTNASRLTYVIPFEEARCIGRGRPTRWAGTRPSAVVERFLRRLARDLNECGEPGRVVEVDVRGFASTSEFANPDACRKGLSSEGANRRVAAARARNVAEVLRRCGRDCPYVKVRHRRDRGTTPESESPRFEDRVNGDYNHHRGALNRRAEIRIRHAAGCEIDPASNLGFTKANVSDDDERR